MADGNGATSKLDGLARLKNLRSGMKTSESPAKDDGEDLSFDSMFAEEDETGTAHAAPAPVIEKPAPPATKPEPPKPNAAAETESESLSSYFEALGIVPDEAKVAGATGKPPVSYTAPSDEYTKPASNAPGRDVDERDLWADPVRNDDTFLSSFAAAGDPDKDTEEDMPSLDSIIGSMGDEEGDAPAIEPEAEPAPVEEIDVPVDIEAFEAEIALADNEAVEEEPVATEAPDDETVEADKPLTITFDESRATLLTHVSKQMGCSIDDVVVTAIDWYLDALFGEEDPDLAASQGD